MEQKIPYRFSPIFEVVNFSQKSSDVIRDEYKKLVQYYKENPYDLRMTMEQTIEILENREARTKDEETALQELKQMLEDEQLDAEKYFLFGEEMLLDDFRKIYKQIRDKYPISFVQNNEEVEIMFYSIGQAPDVPVGEILPTGQINTGSKIIIDKMILKAKDFLVQYQMLHN
jgi:hypothetical protein